MNGEKKHRFNYIYAELVKGPNDIVGLFAYAIYKQEKIEYIKRFKENHINREPEPHELEEFHLLSMGRCGQYRALAEQQLNDFMGEYGTLIKGELDDEYNHLLSQRLDEVKTSFWDGVLQGALGSVLYTVFLGIIVVIILGLRWGLSGILEEGIKMLTTQ